jgi:metal-responsive CopG/Arc/MetJ family transcriptional regulator
MSAGTAIHGVRIEDELWEIAGEICEEKGTSRGEVMRKALERYVARHSN